MNRMACVDRNVLRLAVYELLFCEDIPPKVCINEAIDVGKKFGGEESGSFVNGVMDGIRLSIEKGEIHLETERKRVESQRRPGSHPPSKFNRDPS